MAVVLAAFGLRTQLYTSQERTVTTVFMFVALAQSWNLIGGYTGYACFGQVVFFDVAGYATAVLMTHLHVPFLGAMPVGALLAAGYAVLIGLPLLRLTGHYVAIATLGVADGTREIVINLPKLTNTTKVKVASFALSGFPYDFVGAAYTFQQVTIDSDRLFRS
jgi:branched-chain amino acid transport system permease protein